MTRTENDLRDALLDLERRADAVGAPPTATLLAAAMHPAATARARRYPRWLPPLAAAAVVAAVAIAAVVLSTGSSPSASPRNPAAGQNHTAPRATHHASTPSPTASRHHRAATTSDAAAILDDAAAKLAAQPWTAPKPDEFFYRRTTDATTWTSVSGVRPGYGRADNGTRIWISGCRHGHLVGGGELGRCTLDDVSHYLADAPTTPSAWDAYLEHMAPGSRAADAQGKIIVQVLHEDLVSPQAAAALLRYTENCPGLHTLDVAPVGGEQLTGITCTSMTNGSYGLVFDASSHAFAGFQGVTQSGQPDGSAEVIRKTGIVPAIGRTP